jgi:hypothetical protein
MKNRVSSMKVISSSFVNFLRVGLISSVTTITLSCVSPSHATVQILTDSFLNPNEPAGAELNDNLANRQTGTLATVGYSSSTLNSGPSGSGFAYLNESSNLEINSAVGTHAKVWTTTGFSTSGRTTISMKIWPTVTQTNGSGFASLLVGGGLANTQANDGVLWAGGAANAITVTLYGNGLLTIRDQSKFDGADGEYIYWGDGAFTNNGFKNLKIVSSAFASGSQTLSFYLDNTALLENYTRAAGFTSDNYIGFQAYRNEGATQSVFDNLNITVVHSYNDWAGSYSLNPATDGAPGADPDNDGFLNSSEFAFGTIPTAGSPALLSTATSDGQFVISWLQRTDSPTSYTVQEATDLVAGSWGPSSAPVRPGSGATPPAGYEWKQISVTPTGKKFYRVSASL